MLGLYRYERQGEPVIEPGPGNVDSFQAHGGAPIPIRYWIQTDEAGVPYKQSGEGNPNYLHVLVVQYGPGGAETVPKAATIAGNGSTMWRAAAPSCSASATSATGLADDTARRPVSP